MKRQQEDSIYKDHLDRHILRAVNQKLIEVFGAPIVVDETWKGDNYIVTNKSIQLTIWVGNETDISGITHEIAHIITDRPEQVTSNGHGFKFGRSQLGFTKPDYIFVELDTLVVEYWLRQYADVPESVENLVKPLVDLPDIDIFPELCQKKYNIQTFDKDFLLFCEAYLLQKIPQITLPEIVSEYQRKVEIMNAYFRSRSKDV